MSIQSFKNDFRAYVEREINTDYYDMSVERLGL